MNVLGPAGTLYGAVLKRSEYRERCVQCVPRFCSRRKEDKSQTKMGVTVETTKQGSGASPQKGQNVTVHCTGFVIASGKKFWSTKDPGQQPFSFNIGLGQVIRGWDEGVMQMRVGEHATLRASPDYAYGASASLHHQCPHAEALASLPLRPFDRLCVVPLSLSLCLCR